MSDSININKFNAKGLNQNGRTTQKLYNMKDLKHKKSPKYIFLIFKFVLKQLTLDVLPILDCKLEGLRVRLSSSIF